MRLLIREHVFTWSDRFTVTDEFGVDRYYVEGEVFSFGRKLHVRRTDDTEAVYIAQELFHFRPRYGVWIGNAHRADVVREFSFFHPVYTVEGPGWDVEGDFWAHDYRLTSGGRTVATISKEWFTWGDCYVLDVANAADELIALATMLTIDCMVEQASN